MAWLLIVVHSKYRFNVDCKFHETENATCSFAFYVCHVAVLKSNDKNDKTYSAHLVRL
jgi:hypothetical protein